MINNDNAVLAAFARDMSLLLSRLAEDLGSSPIETPVQSIYGPTTMNLPWKERLLRQSLILHDIQEAGGSVDPDTWKRIAARYGYTGRGLAGFFRSNGQGLLDTRRDGKVFVTKHGRERLSQNRERVNRALAEKLAPTG